MCSPLPASGNELEGKGVVPDLIVALKKDVSAGALPSGQVQILIEKTEKDGDLRIALEILKRTSSASLEALKAAAREVGDAEQRRQPNK